MGKPGSRSAVIGWTKQNQLGNWARDGESPVSVRKTMEQDPEYHGARGTLWEAGGTTLQGETLIWTDSE